MFKKILVPVDGSLQSQAALQPARALAQLTRSQVLLVRSLGPPQEGRGSPLASSSSAAYARERIRCEKYLAALTEEIRLHGLEANWKLLDCKEEVVENLLWAIEHESADLVVMTSHSRRGAQRWLRASIAAKLIRCSPCPVLVIGRNNKSFRGLMGLPCP